MYYPSNYVQQSELVGLNNNFQLSILQRADFCTHVRELGKLGLIAGLVSTATSVILNSDPTLSLSMTTVGGVSWLVGKFYAKKLEPEAEEIIKNLKTFARWKKSKEL